MTRMALFVAPLALSAAIGCNDRDDDIDNAHRDDVYGAPSSPLQETPGAPATTTRPGLGEGEREQGGAIGNEAMGGGAPASPMAPSAPLPSSGSMDSGATDATGVSPPSSAGTGPAPLPSGDASSGSLAPTTAPATSGTFYGQPMSSGATTSGDASGTTPSDAADDDLNDNEMDDDDENEQGDTTR